MRRIALLAAMVSALCSFSSFAQGIPSCDEVRRVRAFAASRGIDSGLAAIEAEVCAAPRRHEERRHGWHAQSMRTLDDEEFRVYVVQPLLRASVSEEVGICQQLSGAVRLSTDQVAELIRHVAVSSEASCALAFYPRVTDAFAWERVYAPMSVSAEHAVRAAIARSF